MKILTGFIDYAKMIKLQARQNVMRLDPEKSKKLNYSKQAKVKYLTKRNPNNRS